MEWPAIKGSTFPATQDQFNPIVAESNTTNQIIDNDKVQFLIGP